MIALITALLVAFTEACKVYVARLEWDKEHEQDQIEDEIQSLASNGSPASKLRIEVLAGRLKRKRLVRPADSDPVGK